MSQMDGRDLLAIPVVATLGTLIALAHKAGDWGDTLTFVVAGVVGSIVCICLYHVDWRPLRSGSRPRMHY